MVLSALQPSSLPAAPRAIAAEKAKKGAAPIACGSPRKTRDKYRPVLSQLLPRATSAFFFEINQMHVSVTIGLKRVENHRPSLSGLHNDLPLPMSEGSHSLDDAPPLARGSLTSYPAGTVRGLRCTCEMPKRHISCCAVAREIWPTPSLHHRDDLDSSSDTALQGSKESTWPPRIITKKDFEFLSRMIRGDHCLSRCLQPSATPCDAAKCAKQHQFLLQHSDSLARH